MKEITALVLNDEDGTSYYTAEATSYEGIGVKSIFSSSYSGMKEDFPFFLVELFGDHDNIEIPYHSVLLIRREK